MSNGWQAKARRNIMEPGQARACMARVEELILQLLHRWRRKERGDGLSWPQRFLLRYLRRHGPTHPHVLARELGVTRATLTGLLDVLEARGYVGRLPNREDRRTLWVDITPSGRKALRRHEEQSQRRILSALMALDAADADALVRFLEKLVEAWNREDEAGGPDRDGKG